MLVNNGLLTKGLGVNLPACFSMITGRFSLFINISILQRHPRGGGGGNKIIINPNTILQGEDQSLLDHPIFTNEFIQLNDLITLKIKFGEREIEKEFIVPKLKMKPIVSVLQFLNITKNKVNIKINNIKEIKNKLFAKISKFKIKN